MKHPFQVWQFRVRDYLHRRGDTKKTREGLHAKFDKRAHPLIAKLLAERDAEREYRAVATLRSSHLTQVAVVTAFLEGAARCIGEFREAHLNDLPTDVRKSVSALIAAWEDRDVKVRHILQPYTKTSDTLQRRATKLHTEWIRATQAAKDAHAKLPEDVP